MFVSQLRIRHGASYTGRGSSSCAIRYANDVMAAGDFATEQIYTGRGSVWLERLVRDQEVDSSNLSAPTKSLSEV